MRLEIVDPAAFVDTLSDPFVKAIRSHGEAFAEAERAKMLLESARELSEQRRVEIERLHAVLDGIRALLGKV